MFSSFVMAAFWVAGSPEPANCCSAAWAAGLEYRPKSPAAGLPIGAVSELSSQLS